MSLRRFLIHRCTLIVPDQKTGEDEYGRPQYGDKEIEDVPCRADEVRHYISRDENGADFLKENVLFLMPKTKLLNNMKVEGVKDKGGHDVMFGTYKMKEITPVYNSARLHHYEVTLKKE